jgi:hypothetical protein
MITHPFHPLKGQRLTVLFTQHKRTGLYFVCEVEGRLRVTVPQEWTDRGVPASSDRLAVDGLTAVRALLDALDPGGTEPSPVAARVGEEDGQQPGAEANVRLGSPPGGDGGGEHGRVATTRDGRR